MTMRPGHLTAAAAAALLLMAGTSLAQSTATSGSGTTASSSTSTAGAFDSLSPGEQKIARALFLAQHTSSSGPMPLSLNQIAALKQKEGWGEVFKEMKAEGLVEAKNLGQVVSGYEHHLHAAHKMPSHMVMTTASGHAFDAGTPRTRGEGARDRDSDADDARSGSPSTHSGDRDDAATAGGGSAHGGVTQTASTNSASSSGMHGASVGRGR